MIVSMLEPQYLLNKRTIDWPGTESPTVFFAKPVTPPFSAKVSLPC